MNDRSSALRNRANRLVAHLVETTSDVEVEAALRHLSVAGLNLAVEADADSLLAASRALSWLAVYVAWDDDEATLDELAGLIDQGKLAPNLGPRTVASRLSRAIDAPSSPIRRSPTGAALEGQDDDLRALILSELADHDRRVARAAALAPHRRRDALFSDSQLLATVLELSTEDHLPPAAQTMVELLPEWNQTSKAAPKVLARFERAQFEDVPAPMNRLGERPRRFEQSMGRHLERHHLLPAVRAALTLSSDADESQLRLYLNQSATFAEDPPLVELALALIEMRHRTARHLAGALPLAGLSPWVTYLRGPCADFAESRGITLREATNFAHYSLHLLNICDLAARQDVPLTDTVRRALMDIENEIKEFALVGQRQGLTDEQSDLGRYERSRWRSDGARALLASRLARLCGAWRAGHRPGPPGSPPRPDHELFDHCLELVRDREDTDLDALAHLAQKAHLRGLPDFNDWTPEEVLLVLTPVLFAARSAPSIDVDAPFTVDFEELSNWLAGADRHQRASIVTTLAAHYGDAQGGAAIMQSLQGLSAQADDQRLLLAFRPAPELEAILTLLADVEGDDPLSAPLRQRLKTLLEAQRPLAQATAESPCSNRERT